MSEWQPIETAPKDGTWILAYREPARVGKWHTLVPMVWVEDADDFVWPDRNHAINVYIAICEDDRWIMEGDYYEAGGTFTHWMPLPDPPTP